MTASMSPIPKQSPRRIALRRLSAFSGIRRHVVGFSSALKRRVVGSRRKKETSALTLALVVIVALGAWSLVGSGTSPSPPLSNTPAPDPVQTTIAAPTFPTPGGATASMGAYDAVTCITVTQCLAVGATSAGVGSAASSGDGGGSWAPLTVPIGTPELDAVTCVDASNCVAVGADDAVVTTDGGTTWALNTVADSSTTLLGVACATASDCVADGVVPGAGTSDGGRLFVSGDGGASWTAAAMRSGMPGLGGLACPTATLCIAVGDAVLVSGDGGQTWQQRTVVGGMDSLRTVSCASPLDCIAVGPNAEGASDANATANAIVTSDGGTTWRNEAMPVGTSPVQRISCGSAQQCLAVGPGLTSSQAPVFLASTDGGSTWSAAPAPAGMVGVADASCVSGFHCVAVGRTTSGPAAATTEDGVTWTTTAAAVPA